MVPTRLALRSSWTEATVCMRSSMSFCWKQPRTLTATLHSFVALFQVRDYGDQLSSAER